MKYKNWRYREITDQAESRIRAYMGLAFKHKSDRTLALIHEQTAWGVFQLWDTLTCGWQCNGDRERLESLTRLERQAA